MGAVALAATWLSSGAAWAESEWVRVYDVGEAKVGRAEVAQVEKSCNFHMMSRMGPDPREVAACTAAVTRLNARGVAAVPAILASLDREQTSYAARERLYGALAQTGDQAVAAKMIDAMAKVAQTRVDQRTYETSQMEEVAENILRASPGERAPWVQQAVSDPYAQITDRVVTWRLHQQATAGRPLDEVVAERVARARLEKSDADAQKAFLAVRYLIEVDPAEGLAAAEALAQRFPVVEGVRDPVRAHIDSLRRSATYKVRLQAEEAAEAAAKVKSPRSPKAPPAEKAKRKTPELPADPKARS